MDCTEQGKDSREWSMADRPGLSNKEVLRVRNVDSTSQCSIARLFQVRRSISRILQQAPVQVNIVRDVRRKLEFAVAEFGGSIGRESHVFKNGLPGDNTAAVQN